MWYMVPYLPIAMSILPFYDIMAAPDLRLQGSLAPVEGPNKAESIKSVDAVEVVFTISAIRQIYT